MKRLIILLVTVAMIISVSGTVLGGIGFAGKASMDIDRYDLIQFEAIKGRDKLHSWYSIQPEQPGFKAEYFYIESDLDVFNLEYYKDDQTFAQYGRFKYGDSEENLFAAGYLFDFGLFITASDWDEYTIVSPGYRWSFDENSYLAFRYVYDTEDSEGIAYVVNGKHYTDQWYLRGTIAKMDGEWNDDLYYQLAANYQLFDNTVVGLAVADIDDETFYDLGCTWGNEDSRVIVDAAAGRNSWEINYLTLSGMVHIVDNLRIGAQYETYDEDYMDDQTSIKVTYNKGMFQFSLNYLLDYGYAK